MSNNTKSQFTPEEHSLFNKIAADIKNNSRSYHQAGKWLDKFYNEIGEKGTFAIFLRFDKARDSLSKQYKDLKLISEEDAKKVILITWLLTDPDAENANLNITEFEKWKWGALDDITKLGRGYKGLLFSQNKDDWMRLVDIAWKKITESKDSSPKTQNNKFPKDTKRDLEILIEKLDRIENLKSESVASEEFSLWFEKTKTAVRNIFGVGSEQYEKICNVLINSDLNDPAAHGCR